MPERFRRDAIALIVATGLLVSALAATGTLTTPVAVASVFAGLVIPVASVVCVSRRQPPHDGPADTITLVRAGLAGGIATLVMPSIVSRVAIRDWEITVLASLALVLDGVDGLVARRTRTLSDAGARLDMEVDAAIAAITAIPVALTIGWWSLPLGYLRYGFAIAAHFWPAIRQPLPPSSFRKVVGTAQAITLVTALIPVVPMSLRTALVASMMVIVLTSFARDFATLLRASGND